MISNRAKGALADPSPLVVAHFEAAKDAYHPVKNPTGAINLGTAENYLMEEELLAWLAKVPPIAGRDMHYEIFRGRAVLRETLARFLRDASGITDADPEHIVIGSGVSSLLESLAHVLFDEGESLIIPAPYYTGYEEDFSHRFGVNVIPATMHEDNGFELDVAILDQVYAQAVNEGEKVKAILINNPNNPLGVQYTRPQLESLIDFAENRGLQIIADEIYAHSIFDDCHGNFESVLTVGEHYKDSIHVLYGLAKDFGLSGFKFALCYSTNTDVLAALAVNAYFYNVSTLDQHVVNAMFLDMDYVREFLARYKKKLSTAHKYLLIENDETIQAAILPSQGGHFVFMSLADRLPEQSPRGEMQLYENLWSQAKVNITPGQFFGCMQPGWFRLCFANDPKRVKEAFIRMKRCLP